MAYIQEEKNIMDTTGAIRVRKQCIGRVRIDTNCLFAVVSRPKAYR